MPTAALMLFITIVVVLGKNTTASNKDNKVTGINLGFEVHKNKISMVKQNKNWGNRVAAQDKNGRKIAGEA